MSSSRIRQAMETTLAAWAAAQSPPILVAFENVPFNPSQLTRYVACSMRPAQTTSQDFAGKHRSYTGFFQIDIYSNTGDGPGASLLIVDSLDSVFSPSTPIIWNGLSVYIRLPITAGPNMQEPGWHHRPVTVGYVAHVLQP